jgi:hypothetical protein
VEGEGDSEGRDEGDDEVEGDDEGKDKDEDDDQNHAKCLARRQNYCPILLAKSAVFEVIFPGNWMGERWWQPLQPSTYHLSILLRFRVGVKVNV